MTQGRVDQVCRNSIQEPSALFWHCVMGCVGHACVLRLVHTVIGGLIINPTEEIGILVMVTHKWGKVCPVDSLHQSCGADICRMATSSLTSVLLKSHKALGFDSVVALLSLFRRGANTLRYSSFPQDFRAFPSGLVHDPLDKPLFILFQWTVVRNHYGGESASFVDSLIPTIQHKQLLFFCKLNFEKQLARHFFLCWKGDCYI